MHSPAPVAMLLVLGLSAASCAPTGETGVEDHGQIAEAPVLTPDRGGTCVLDPPAQPIVCTMEWDPVCGCDGKTYGNACAARGAGVPTTTPGACEDTSK